MSRRKAKHSSSKNKGPFEPGAVGGVSFLSGKALDKCFLEVLRAILYGLGGSRPDGLPFKRDTLFAYACKTFHIADQHAQNLLQQVSSEQADQALHVEVLAADDVADTIVGANTRALVTLTSLHDPTLPTTESGDTECPQTEIQMSNVNPEFGEDFAFDLDHVDDIGLLVEIWCYPHEGRDEAKQEEGGVLSRFFKRFTTSTSVEEGLSASLLIPLHHIHPSGVQKWYHMKSRQNLDTRCHLNLSFIPDKANPPGSNQEHFEEACSQYRSMARTFLTHQLEESLEKSDLFGLASPWFEWSMEADDILSHFGQQHHLTRLQQNALAVEALTQMSRSLTVTPDALVHYSQRLLETFDNRKDKLSAAEEASVKHTLDDVINFVFGRFSVSVELFPPRSNQLLSDIKAYVDLLLALQVSLAWQRCLPDTSAATLAQQAKMTMQVRIKAWYLASVEFSMGFCKELAGLATISQKMTTVVSSFLVALETASKAYSEVFSGFELSYHDLCVGHFYTLLLSDLDKFTRIARSTLEHAMQEQPLKDKTRQLLSTSCLLLQRLLGQTLQLEAAVKKTCDEETWRSESTDCHGYFERLVPGWMKQLQIQTEDCIKLAVSQEKLLPTGSSSAEKSCVSAQAVLAYAQLLEEPWSEVCQWPDPVIGFLASAKLLDVMADLARMYIQQIIQALPNFNLRKERSTRVMGKRVCMALTGMHSFLRLLHEPPFWMEWSTTLSKLKEQTDHTAGNVLLVVQGPTSRLTHQTSTEDIGSQSIGPALMSAGLRDVRQLLRKAVQAFLKEMTSNELPNVLHQVVMNAGSDYGTPTDIVSPLTAWLQIYHTMFTEQQLDADIYGIVILEMWDMILSALLVDVAALTEGKEKTCQRIVLALMTPGGLLSFFIGLTSKSVHYNQESFKTPTLNRVKHILMVESCSSENLVAFYYSELLLYPDAFGAASHGHVQVMLQHQQNSVVLEVRNAKKLHSVDGVCNSYVLIQFQPAIVFNSTSDNKSSVIMKRTNPIYDFTVKTLVTEPTGMLPEYSVAVVNVMHSTGGSAEDVLLGQAVLPLAGAMDAGGHQQRHDLPLLLCSHSAVDPGSSSGEVSLHSLNTLRRRVSSDVEASTQCAILEKTLEMGDLMLATLGQSA